MFIEVTDKSGVKLSINKSQIVTVWKVRDYCGIDTVINHSDQAIYVKESYEEVKEKLSI